MFNDSSLIPAVIGTEIYSIIACLIVILGNTVINKTRTKRFLWFNAFVACTIFGCFCDVFSIFLDPYRNLRVLHFFFTTCGTFMTLIMGAVFVTYLMEYIKERRTVSTLPVKISWTYAIVSSIATIICALMGKLYYFENDIFITGSLYSLYVLVNVGSMIIGFLVIIAYKKALDTWDRVAAYTYILVPVLMAIINLFIEDWSFAYPSISVSILLVYAIINSDRVKTLESDRELIKLKAAHDELTGLNNRHAYAECLENIKLFDGECGIVFSDLNGLKYTNDHFGHQAGDDLIVRYTDILSQIFRANEIYRISGDEFVCVLSRLDEKVFLDRVKELEETLNVEKPPLASFDVSFGLCKDVDLLIKKAEEKMYLEKEMVHKMYPITSRC